MHNLGYSLVIAAERVRKTGDDKFAKEIRSLASASHQCDPIIMTDGHCADELLDDMNEEWSRKYHRLLYGKEEEQ
jgi:hypothetical protein